MCTAAVCFRNELKPWVWFTAGLVKLKPDGVLGLQELSSLSARDADLQMDVVSPLGGWNSIPFSQFQPTPPLMSLIR